MEDTMRDILSKLDNILTESAVAQGVEEAKNAAQQAAIAVSMKKDGKKPKNEDLEEVFQVGDDFGISFSEDFEIATEIVGFVEDGIVVELDEHAIELLAAQGLSFLEGQIQEGKQKGVDGKACWDGYKRMGTKQKGGKTVDNCVKMEDHGPENPDDPVNYGEYDREGDMAKDDLRTINGAAKELYDILDADENLPEWVQSKITKAVDYIDTVRDYMKSNKYEEDIDEAKYQGREVPLGKKMAGDVKKSKVYVRKPNGNIVKVNFDNVAIRLAYIYF
jgi:hypothetical protein